MMNTLMTLKAGPRNKNYSVPAIHRCLDILERMATEERGLSITEVSRAFQIPKSSVFGILQTLKDRGYVQKETDDRYALTLKLFALGSALIESLDIRKRLYPFLAELTEKSRLTGHIAVLDNGFAVYIEKVEVLGAIRLTTRIGKRMLVHSTAIGKALIAHLPGEEIDRIIARRGLARQTSRTITTARDLKTELARVRTLGYAASDEENEEGVRAVAAPIFDHSGAVVAAVNLGGATIHITSKNMAALGKVVRAYAMQMSRRLGYRVESSNHR